MPVFAFGPFRLDPREQTLVQNDHPLTLTPKALDLLAYLVQNHGRLLRKEELLRAVWPDTCVEEAVLSVNMSAIRRALGDDRNGHTYIETVPRRGYRFVAPVQELEATEASPAPAVAADAGAVEPRAVDALAPGPRSPDALAADAPATRDHLRARLSASRVAWASAALVIGLLIAGAGQQLRRHLARPSSSSSIAVLPLQNLSAGGDQEQFADEMTDMLITSLGQIPALRVVSRQSIVQYKQSRKAMPAIARELNVEYIAEGTVVRDGDRVRITAQLIDGPTDRHVWARSYERDLRGTFALQSDVAESIAREIGVTVSGARRSGAADVPAEAYEAYLRGTYQLDAGNRLGAIDEFHKAIAVYPRFAAAYARIASSYFGPAFFGGMAPHEAWGGMKEAALKAVEYDDTLAEAHSDLALVKLHYDWDWPGAEHEFRRALQLNPSDADVRHNYAHYLLTVGRPGASLTEMDRAFEIDPVGDGTAT